MAREYHHGDLPAALRAATVELIAERGPSGFSLREVARRAGVSHAAPAHHFGDTRGLLTSVAAEGYANLAEALAAAAEHTTDARSRLRECGRAYVRTALANPGHYSVMIGHDHTDRDSPEMIEPSVRAYEQLLETIAEVRDEFDPDLDIDSTATVCWAAMHGLVELSGVLGHVAESTGTSTTALDELVERFTNLIIDGISSE